MDRQERILRMDSVAKAYVTAGRLDKLGHSATDLPPPKNAASQITQKIKNTDEAKENGRTLRRKQMFLSQMNLQRVTTQYKEGESSRLKNHFRTL